jgi:murein DD-endopeptidase MepM/ murein hydrolase activator NlpD
MKFLRGGWILFFCVSIPFFVFADNDIKDAIAEKERQIELLEQQINQYQNQVQYYSGQAKTLNQEVSNLRSSEKVLETSLKNTNTKIQKTNYTIDQQNSEIQDLSQGITTNRQAVAETLRNMQMQDMRSPVEMFLRGESLSDFLQVYQDLTRLQNALRGSVQIMRDKTIQLATAQQELQDRKAELESLSGRLSDEERIIADQRKQKDAILRETKNKETEYQKVVAELERQRAQIDAEIRDFESKLKFSLNPQSLPPIGSSPLGWPIDEVVITQRFGKTVDAKRLYVSGSHSGVDFRAAVGTPIYSVADGIVEGVGDTDKTCPKASFGKWVFIRHNNGLSTAYGHLSLIKATQGQTVKKGDLIGYSGNTGRSTGPHLHLTVYASNGVDGEEGARVTERPSTACSGKMYTMPLAPVNAYLDPMLYLPTSGFTYK